MFRRYTRGMPAVLHPDSCHFDSPAASYWDASAAPLGHDCPALAGDDSCDIAIIGAGYTGLSAALALASEHQLDVRVLEAATPGWGASRRNGGFCSIGGHKRSFAAMTRIYGLRATQQLRTHQRDAVALVRALCHTHGINAAVAGEGEIALAHSARAMRELVQQRDDLRRHFDEPSELVEREQLRARGMYGPQFFGGLMGTHGFGLHPLEYARGLARAGLAAGVRIHAQSRVTKWQELSHGHMLRTADASLRARQVLVATNGYTPESVSTRHAGRVLPALSNVLVTQPLSAAQISAQGWSAATMAYDTRELLHYFRLLPDQRFLFGGRGGTDASADGEGPARAALQARFRELFPAWQNVEIDYFWRGLVCLAYDLVPYLGPLDARGSIWTALAFHGNGVAMATWCGQVVAGMMVGRSRPADISAVLTRRLAKFPLPALRPLYLAAAYRWYGWCDAR